MDKSKLRQIDFDKLQNFYTLFREGSIAKASLATGVSRRTYYYDLAVLEEVFETKLYLAGKKNFVVTEEGKRLADFCKTLIESLPQITNSESTFVEGNLIIHTTVGMGAYYFPSVIKEFNEKYPKINIELLSGAEYFGSKHYDFDVSVGPYLSDKRDLSQHVLKTFEYGYFASEEYLKKYGTPQKVEDFKQHQLLCHSGIHFIPDEVLNRARIIVKCNSYVSLLGMCILGLGICSLPLDFHKLTNLNNEHQYRKIVRILPDIISEKDNVYFSFFRFTTKEKCIRDLFEVLKILVKLEK